MNIKHLFINLAFGLLCWLIMISCVLLAVQEIKPDVQYSGIPEVEIRPTIIKEGCFDVSYINGVPVWYPRKQRF